jgi:hypothetical protein
MTATADVVADRRGTGREVFGAHGVESDEQAASSRVASCRTRGPRARSRILGLVLVGLLGGCSRTPDPELITQTPWALSGPWLVVDLHSHTRFSDGKLPVEQLADLAVLNGCDGLAVTDHGDLSVKAATRQYFKAVAKVRDRHPDLALFGGLEWNISSYEGREHVNVLMDPRIEAKHLQRFRTEFEHGGANTDEALQWLAERVPEDGAVLVYNHPSRKDEMPGENREDLQRWRQSSRHTWIVEGGPGHQKAREIGSYKYTFRTVDRWDPFVAHIGGEWDSILGEGHDIWAALATSDWHNPSLDEEPCAFARTHVQVPERSPTGILSALRAGSFWADHGRILERVALVLSTPKLELPASPGESVRLHPGQPATLRLTLQRGVGSVGEELQAELIGNGRTGEAELLATALVPADESTVEWSFSDLLPGADGRSCYFRVRVRRRVADGPDLLAYTNPIRVILR